MGDERFAYPLSQVLNIGQLALDEDDIREALENTLRWAEISYDKLVEGDAPALYAASTVVAAINACLMNRVMQPPD